MEKQTPQPRFLRLVKSRMSGPGHERTLSKAGDKNLVDECQSKRRRNSSGEKQVTASTTGFLARAVAQSGKTVF